MGIVYFQGSILSSQLPNTQYMRLFHLALSIKELQSDQKHRGSSATVLHLVSKRHKFSHP